MYKYGISYYKEEGGVKVPLSGLDVRILRPGGDWELAIPLIELGVTGYYEVIIDDEEDCGFYEIWDNLNDPDGLFSGRYCIIGKLDGRGIQNGTIFGNHILDGVITGEKVANSAIGLRHLNDDKYPLSKVEYIEHDESNGVGNTTAGSPADISIDTTSTHVFDREFDEVPTLILVSYCAANLYIQAATVIAKELTVVIGINNIDAEALKYRLYAFV